MVLRGGLRGRVGRRRTCLKRVAPVYGRAALFFGSSVNSVNSVITVSGGSFEDVSGLDGRP
jgi:hypothetical protein